MYMMKDKTYAIRDPVHDYIILNPAELELVDSPFIQRLRWISQLSGVRLVFPGAQHSRIAHVLGVMHLAGEYTKQVYNNHDDVEHKTQLARLSGLLHDVGHGAFSHAYDDTVYKDLYPDSPHGHDVHRMKMIESEYLKPYIEACGVTTKELRDLWKGNDQVLQAIVQGALGADRMDFLLRDAYYSGTSHFGTIASSRLIDNSLVADHDGKPALHYKLKVLEDIFQSLLGRFFMYRGVYFHKASAAADILIRKILEASKGPLNLAARTDNLEEYQWLNEYTLLGEIQSSTDPALDEAKTYVKRLMSRDLPKLVWETTISDATLQSISPELDKSTQAIAQGRFIDHLKQKAKEEKRKMPTLYVNHTYPMSTIDSKEFEIGNIYLYDDKNVLGLNSKSVTLQEAMDNTAYFSSFLSQVNTKRERYVMIRVFANKPDVKWIKKVSPGQMKKEATIEETSY